MNPHKLHILVLDDDPIIRKIISSSLKKNFLISTAAVPSEAFKKLREMPIDILICDIQLPEMDGITLVKTVKDDFPEIEIIMISSDVNLQNAIEALRLGAFDIFKKPLDTNEILLAIERTKKFTTLQQKLQQLERSKSFLIKEQQNRKDMEIISWSPSMDKVKELMYKVAQTPDTSVLITGESGTGKELIARGIHNISSRKDEFFGAVNTSAIPETLFESEFFGHKKGSFTGAINEKVGWFEVANNGSLFLDEIGDMPNNLQIKLLRVLEERTFNKVGSSKQQSFDIRVIAATNKEMEEMSSGEHFRTDLFYRIAAFHIHISPLRERKEDMPVLLSHFIQFFSDRMRKNIKGIDDEAIFQLQRYDFPGNVRELRNMCERAVILCDNKFVETIHFPDTIMNQPLSQEENQEVLQLEEVEKLTIQKALAKANYNKAKAAELLNIQWNALHRRLKKHGIDLPTN
ncbi:sigma-54-dependent Fis family transcriptional regulator [Marinilabiliaceae bacterium JC017]|nr:sigma-54-dependent Fis family transcriptional regulator [Marinilabiliaceae bacterium JC017]